MSEKAMARIGTSGWHYQHWKGPFYPEDSRNQDLLKYYAAEFATAEINNTFYQLPSEKSLANWRDTVPDGFVFAVKASRYITHMKKLKDPEKAFTQFWERTSVLGNKLGPILFQLPPKWKVNPERLENLLDQLPSELQYAFEFRDESWFDDRIYKLIDRDNCGFCVYDYAGRQSPRQLIGGFGYIRLHGPEGAYEGQYDDASLSEWAQTIDDWTGQGRDVYCYFDNDQNGYAAKDALRLRNMIESG